MKSSLSSPEACRFARRRASPHTLHVALLLALLASSATRSYCLSNPTTTPFPRRALLAHDHHHHHDDDHDDHSGPCESFSHEKPRSLCEQFHRSINHRPPPPPPPPPPPEIDPIFGVDKRLVPSGPNPLHN